MRRRSLVREARDLVTDTMGLVQAGYEVLDTDGGATPSQGPGSSQEDRDLAEFLGASPGPAPAAPRLSYQSGQ